MAHWLYKSEPEAWSWQQQMEAGKKGTEWTGVRNFTARNNMRAMKKGDTGFFYHSGGERAIVGTTLYPQKTERPVSTLDAERRPVPTDGAVFCEAMAALRIDETIEA